MTRRRIFGAVSVTLMTVAWMAATVCTGWAQPPVRWKAHDMTRPQPAVVTPPPQTLPLRPPSDAVVLFDGTDLSRWRSSDGGPARWEIKDDFMQAVPNAGYIHTERGFGDVQLHIEWSTPQPAHGHGQGRGNSGVFLMGKYEVQVLDSYQNETYADGHVAAVYGQYPPLVNASLPPGTWQAFDIVFRRPRFRSDGTLETPARVTVIHNGVLVQDNVEPWGPTVWLQHKPYSLHPDRLPLALQEHGDPVRFRNIWIRELAEAPDSGPPAAQAPPVIVLSEETLTRYAGTYRNEWDEEFPIVSEDGQLKLVFEGPRKLELIAHSTRRFSLRWTAAEIEFDLDKDGKPTGLTFYLAGEKQTARRVE
jgi:hypothetical protein